MQKRQSMEGGGGYFSHLDASGKKTASFELQ